MRVRPARSLAGELLAGGLAEESGFGRRLTAAGKVASAEVFTADRVRLGAERTAALLPSFRDLDLRMKQTVTAWQLKPGTDGPIINDHANADYDATVLDGLAGLHSDALVWMAPLAETFPGSAVTGSGWTPR